MGAVVKSKVGEFEEDIREVFLRRLRKEFTGVVQGVSGKKRFLAIFKGRCENDITWNQLTIMKVEKTPMEE